MKCDFTSLDLDPSPYFEEEEDDCTLYPHWSTRLLALVEEIDAAKQKAWLLVLKRMFCKKLMVIFTMPAILVGVIGVVYDTWDNSSVGLKSGKLSQNFSSGAVDQLG